MIPSPFRIVEITLYSMLTFLPFVVMIFYPARKMLRFRPIVTGILVSLLALVHLACDVVIAQGLYPNADLSILAGFLFHGLIYLLLFRQPVGRTLFTWLAVTNLAVFVTTAAKCLEALLFPSMVSKLFGLSYLFLLLLVEALIMGPSLLLVKKLGLVFRFPKLNWNIAWLLPAACTALWYVYMYVGHSFADTWITIRPVNTLFLLVLNLLFALICFEPSPEAVKQRTEADKAQEAAIAEEKAKRDAALAEAKAKRDAERAEAKAKRDAERAEAKAKRDAERAEARAKREAERAEARAKREAEKAEKEAAQAAAQAAAAEVPSATEETVEAAPSDVSVAEAIPIQVPATESPATAPAIEEIETVVVEAPTDPVPQAPAAETTAPAAPVREAAPATADPQDYLLRVQTIQHVNMLEKMTEARRVNQNLQLQLNMMENSLTQNDYRKLREQLHTFQNLIPTVKNQPYCENATVDGLLQYYAQTASSYGTVFNAEVRLPASVGVRGRDLTVLLGNLLDNAIDACRSQKSFDRKIRIRGGISGNSLRFVIGNTYETPVVRDEDGTFHSTKHSGNGIGIEIVKEIVQRYNGTLEYDITDKRFKVSVTLNP